MFARGQNSLRMHFSEWAPIVKWHMTIRLHPPFWGKVFRGSWERTQKQDTLHRYRYLRPRDNKLLEVHVIQSEWPSDFFTAHPCALEPLHNASDYAVGARWDGDRGQASVWAEPMPTEQPAESCFLDEHLPRPFSSFSHSEGCKCWDQKPDSKKELGAAACQPVMKWGCWPSSQGRWMSHVHRPTFALANNLHRSFSECSGLR